MKLLSNEKRAYLGYFLSSIRVDLYNKILLKNILNCNLSCNYDNVNLENNLKVELQNTNKKHYFHIYFQMRLAFYNKYFKPINYTIEEIIDLIYEYRNYLLDDQSRMIAEKFPLILNKTLEEKEEEINTIILLLLSENMLQDFYTYIPNALQMHYDYQSFFYCQDEDIIKYRKYTNKYFGFSNYNNKILYLQRRNSGLDVSHAKKYSLIINLFNNLPFLSNTTKEIFTNLDILLTKDYLHQNYGLVEIPYKNHRFLCNKEQLLIFYFLSKETEKDYLKKFISNTTNKENEVSIKKKQIKILTSDILLFDKAILRILTKTKINKLILNKFYNFKKGKFKKDLNSSLILRMFLNLNLSKLNYKTNIFSFSTTNLVNNILSLEFINYKIIKNNLNLSIKRYLEEELVSTHKLNDHLYVVLNQIKFTMNISDFNKLAKINNQTIYELQKDYKNNKKDIINIYIMTIYILLKLRVHKYYKIKKYENIYVYRNKIMHFQKDLIHSDMKKELILQEAIKLKQNHWKKDILISFNKKFFYLLEYTLDNSGNKKYIHNFL